MYGRRARLGLILPLDNAVMEPELYSLGLEDVSFHTIRLSTTERTEMPDQGVALARGFTEMGVSSIAYCCAETAFLKGTEGNEWIAGEITRTTGLPATTAMSAMVAAVRALGARRIALVTPYTRHRERIMIEFWNRMGVEVTGALSRDFNEGVGDVREWYQTNRQPPTTAYEMARAIDSDRAEAVVISATNFRTLEVIAALEQELGKPVITSNQAILWQALTLAGVRLDRPDLGRLSGLHPIQAPQ